MNASHLQPALEGLGRPKVLVIGDLILDRYVSGEIERISPEAPIPVLSAKGIEERLGGAGNVAANLRAMDAEVEIVGVVGDDLHGRRIVGMMRELEVATEGVAVDRARLTTEKTRMVSGAQQMLRVDWESTHAVDDDLAQRVVGELTQRIATAGAVVLSDYGKGVLTPRVVGGTIEIARRHGVPVLVDPKGTDYARYRGATMITPNRKEAEEALGRKLVGLEGLPSAADELIRMADLSAVVITLGAMGMFLLSKDGQSVHVPTFAREVFDVTGAGDTVIAHLALYLAARMDLETAVHLANYAAGIVVAKPGAASATRAEIFERLYMADRGWRSSSKVLEGDRLATQLALWRSQRKRVVLTTGCFDVLQVGHIDHLRFARAQGDVLLVGVATGGGLLSGARRPNNSVEDRLAVLAALEMVDGVTSFDQNDPKNIVQQVSPDVLIEDSNSSPTEPRREFQSAKRD